MKLLEKKIDSNNCRYSCNWNVLEAKYIKECIESITNSHKCPFVLTLKYQKKKSKEIFDSIAKGKINCTLDSKLLKLLNLPKKSIQSITNSGLLVYLYISNDDDLWIDLIIDKNNNTEIKPEFLSYIIYNKNYFELDMCTSTFMHLLS